MTRIEVVEIGHGSRGAVYCVMHADEVLLAGARTPALDAARALLAKGIVGKMDMWWADAAFPAMVLDIERAAKLTVKEDENRGPRFAKWQPHPQSAPEWP